MGDFRKKRILQTDFEGKNYCQEITGKKFPTLKKIYFTAYNAGKKILHRCVSGKNSITRGLRKKLLHKQNHPVLLLSHNVVFKRALHKS